VIRKTNIKENPLVYVLLANINPSQPETKPIPGFRAFQKKIADRTTYFAKLRTAPATPKYAPDVPADETILESFSFLFPSIIAIVLPATPPRKPMRNLKRKIRRSGD
jgi:hypothetical protein